MLNRTSKKQAVQWTLLSLALFLVLSVGYSVKKVVADSSEETKANIENYQLKRDQLSKQLAQNSLKAAGLKNEVSLRMTHVNTMMRNTQTSLQGESSNVVYEMLFNGKTIMQALAISHLINQSVENVDSLQKIQDELKEAEGKISKDSKEVNDIIDTLNNKYADEMAAEAAAKEAKLAEIALTEKAQKMQEERAKLAEKAKESQNSQKTETDEQAPKPSPEVETSGNWSDYPPTAAAQYVASRTGVSVSQWLAILYRESGGNPTVTNPASGTYGYFQMNGAAHGGVNYQAMSPQAYLDAVVGLYMAQGMNAWAV